MPRLTHGRSTAPMNCQCFIIGAGSVGSVFAGYLSADPLAKVLQVQANRNVLPSCVLSDISDVFSLSTFNTASVSCDLHTRCLLAGCHAGKCRPVGPFQPSIVAQRCAGTCCIGAARHSPPSQFGCNGPADTKSSASGTGARPRRARGLDHRAVRWHQPFRQHLPQGTIRRPQRQDRPANLDVCREVRRLCGPSATPLQHEVSREKSVIVNATTALRI